MHKPNLNVIKTLPVWADAIWLCCLFITGCCNTTESPPRVHIKVFKMQLKGCYTWSIWPKSCRISFRAPKKMKVIPAHVHYSRKFREAFGTLQQASILQQGQRHVKLFALAPGGFLCSAGYPMPTDSLGLPSDSISHANAFPTRGHEYTAGVRF